MSETLDRPLTRREAARMLTERGFPVAETTLTTKASRGGGPPYRIFGRVALYDPAEALEWARSRLEAPAGGK